MLGLGVIAQWSLAGTVLALGAAFIRRRKAPRVFQFGVALMITWVLCRALHEFAGPSFRGVLPFIDFGLICLLLRYTVEITGTINPARALTHAPWWISLALAPLLIQLCTHIAYHPSQSLEERWPFLFLLNIMYVPVLMAILVGAITGKPENS